MLDDATEWSGEQAASPATETAEPLLARMEVGAIGRRDADGCVSTRPFSRLGSLLYGPNLRLAAGRYRVHFRCRVGVPRRADLPVLGLEVIAQDRVQQGWRDWLAHELTNGGSIDFEVPDALASRDSADIPFEFRLLHFGNARLTITSLSLGRLDPSDDAAPARRRWRLLGRLHRRWLSLHNGGYLSMGWLSPLRLMSDSCTPHLRLPAGRYRLVVQARPRLGGNRATLGVEVVTRDGDVLGGGTFRAADLAAPAGGMIDFDVAAEMSMECGATLCVDIRLLRSHPLALQVSAVDLHLLTEAPPVAPAAAAILQARRAKLVVIGNCQADLVSIALRENATLRGRFRAVYHAARLQAHQFEQARRDLDGCDVVLVQDIQDCASYPLREHIPPGALTVTFPFLRFASLWPFDGYNGADDRVARLRDYPNFEFTYRDGLLGRLRKEIPDPAARLVAYRTLAVEGVVDCRALHRFEEKRLLAMDRKFGGDIGAFILRNFRDRQLFHTTGHPNADLFATLLSQIAGKLGIELRPRRNRAPDGLQLLQIPVHPEVARRLGVRWANGPTRYAYRGSRITWEEYVSRYIAYYG
jgi:hypothetical protein